MLVENKLTNVQKMLSALLSHQMLKDITEPMLKKNLQIYWLWKILHCSTGIRKHQNIHKGENSYKCNKYCKDLILGYIRQFTQGRSFTYAEIVRNPLPVVHQYQCSLRNAIWMKFKRQNSKYNQSHFNKVKGHKEETSTRAHRGQEQTDWRARERQQMAQEIRRIIQDVNIAI